MLGLAEVVSTFSTFVRCKIDIKSHSISFFAQIHKESMLSDKRHNILCLNNVCVSAYAQLDVLLQRQNGGGLVDCCSNVLPNYP